MDLKRTARSYDLMALCAVLITVSPAHAGTYGLALGWNGGTGDKGDLLYTDEFDLEAWELGLFYDTRRLGKTVQYRLLASLFDGEAEGFLGDEAARVRYHGVMSTHTVRLTLDENAQGFWIGPSTYIGYQRFRLPGGVNAGWYVGLGPTVGFEGANVSVEFSYRLGLQFLDKYDDGAFHFDEYIDYGPAARVGFRFGD